MDERDVELRPRGGVRCLSCGASADKGQLVCLECGSRIALDYRRPFGWKLPLAIITVVLVLTGGGLAFALNAIDDDARTEVAGESPARTPAADKDDDDKAKSKGDRKPKPREPKPARRRPAPARTGTWPRGRSAFTVVLATTESRRSATSLVRNVRQRGNRAGYLRSDDFSSLERGSWIVFSGVYRTRPEAERAASRLGRAFPGGFAQFVNGAERPPRR